MEPLEPRHAEFLFEGLLDERLYDFIDAQPPQDVESLRTRYARLAERCSPDGTEAWLNWALWSRADHCYVGYVQATVKANLTAEIAYLLFPHHWGKGYAHEAVSAMLVHLRASHDVSAFTANVDPRNLRSVAILERLGFTRVALHTGKALIRDMVADECEYIL